MIRATLLAVALACCMPALSPADDAELAGTAADLAKCQDVALACKADGGAAADCYAKYEACKVAAGLADGGTDGR